MSREIKFRAWDGEKMIYSHNNSINPSNSQLEWFFRVIRKYEIVMQFTGLTDKNGKEIYESDIVTFREGRIGIVKWNQQWACFYFSFTVGNTSFYCDIKSLGMSSDGHTYTLDNVFVIGNIYESPQLLTK